MKSGIQRLVCRPLPPQAASHVFIMEPNMNPAVEAQAIGRAYRMGQTSAVSVHRLVVKDTVEERIQKMLEARNQAAPAGGAGPGQDERDHKNAMADMTEAAAGAANIYTTSSVPRAFSAAEVAYLVGARAKLE